MRIRSPQDFWAGLMFVAFGGAAIYFSRTYPFGTAANMGPGYFPTALGGILIVLGLITLTRGLSIEGAAVGRFNWKPAMFALGSVALFGATMEWLGLAVAIFALTIFSALGSHEFRLKEVIVLAAFLATGSVAIFVYGLELPFPIWPR